jgi:hypothetical protein
MTSFARILTLILNLFESLSNPVKMAAGLFTLALAAFDYVNDMWAELFTRVDAMAAPSVGAADFTGLGMVNYIFPLDTVCTYISAYAVLRLACGGVRIIKSFIPTVS